MAEKILIVDDDPDTLKFINIFLKHQGFETFEAQRGLEALKLANELMPDLIILDVMMPGIDGFEVARSLRRQPETAHIPILMFTAKSQTQDRIAGYESGVDIFLTKPIHPVELQANIKTLINQRQERTQLLSKKGYIIGVIAARGGLGVSTIALNLALVYRQKYQMSVIAAELRPGQGTWAAELGISNSASITDLLKMNITEITTGVVEKQLVHGNSGVPLLVADMSPYNFDCLSALNQYEVVVGKLSLLSQMIILDIGTSYHPAYEVLAKACDEIIVILEPQPVTVKKTRPLLLDLRTRDFGSAKALTLLTVNRTRLEMSMSASQIGEILGQTVALGFPPVPELAYQSQLRSTPIAIMQPDSVIARQFDTLATIVNQHISGIAR
jgi:DNA-binding response OmpR family regulator